MARAKKVRPPHKGKLSEAGLWSLSVGDRPYTVTVREDRRPGARLIFDFTAHGRRRQTPAGMRSVRDSEGQFDRALVDAAEQRAWDQSSRLRLDTLRQEVAPQRLTVGEALAMYTDPESGGVASSKSSQQQAKAAKADWINHLGRDTLWNRVLPKDIDALARSYKRRGMIPTAEQRIKWLRTAFRWLENRARIRGLEDPTKGFDFAGLTEGYEPRRPRYRADEVEKILAVRFEVDPRFALLSALMDDSGTRRAGLIRTWRSALDQPLDIAPTQEDAPFGWIVFPALKGQDRVLHFLTEFERRELDMALSTHLSALEERWQKEGVDYPLFPSARMYPRAKQERLAIPPSRPGAYQPVKQSITEKWLRDAETKADVDHIVGRLWHGWRRLVSDVLHGATDLGTLTTALGWKSQRTPEQIYVSKQRHTHRARAREAMERRRKGTKE